MNIGYFFSALRTSILECRVDKDADGRITKEEIKGSGRWREDPIRMLTKQGKELWLLFFKILIDSLAHFFIKL
ncbi:hypothetical protein PIB30_110211 [Stylosanthes scabra]|uniref:EF-hand domain-containing protein n=1 Tax=Stylosanthes scabra TaxID=79078 RepID=A0ABU6W0K3_9FABA|nr:hypothetical protein [Stylosanthes scabra]